MVHNLFYHGSLVHFLWSRGPKKCSFVKNVQILHNFFLKFNSCEKQIDFSQFLVQKHMTLT